MAKSARASSTKRKNAILREKVFDPIDAARKQAQSERLWKLAMQPKPARPEKMDVDSDPKKQATNAQSTPSDAMDIDGEKTESKGGTRQKSMKGRTSKYSITKTRRGKPTSGITFKRYNKGRLVDDGRRKKRK